MGVYLFNLELLDRALWEDHNRPDSSHDFGKDILPRLINRGERVFAFPYTGYWVDVGTVNSYWQAHMDQLEPKPPFDLNDRSWIIHTRTEERPPVWIAKGAEVTDSMITDGCELSPGAKVERSCLSAGVRIGPGAIVRNSIIFTDASIAAGAVLEHCIIDKRVKIGENTRIGGLPGENEPVIAMVGKNSIIPANTTIEPGAVIGTDVIESDFSTDLIRSDDYIQTKRLAYEF
jgi:glucose-1-phosphate adenylyltransferase